MAITNRLPSGTGQVWQLTSANAITRLSDISFVGASFTNTLPPQSITLFVLPAGVPPPPELKPGTLSQANNTFDFFVNGQTGQRYILWSTVDFSNWTPVQTNTLTTNSWHAVLPVTGPRTFYRAQWSQ